MGYTGAVASLYPGSCTFVCYYHDDKQAAHQYSISTASNFDARFFTQITPDLSGAGPLARLTNAQQAVPADATGGVTYVRRAWGWLPGW